MKFRLDKNGLVFHYPNLDVEKCEKHYSEKDGVDVKYVCTTQLPNQNRSLAYDVYYREKPHPEFGNRYFGLIRLNSEIFICNADKVEELFFECVSDNTQNKFYYSTHAHDFWSPPNSTFSIDGGRDYTRLVGNVYGVKSKIFEIRNGEMLEEKT